MNLSWIGTDQEDILIVAANNGDRYRRNNPGLEQAIIGTELLRLAGGPNRGWYPTRKANQPRPASIEHLERLNNAFDARLTGPGDQRKPLTLPTNITPNKYFGQSKHSSASSTREALRRVTSLLIKKGKRWNLRYYGEREGEKGREPAVATIILIMNKPPPSDYVPIGRYSVRFPVRLRFWSCVAVK